MSTRFCKIYSSAPVNKFAGRFIQRMECEGYSLLHPNTHEVRIWKSGNPEFVSLESFLSLLNDPQQEKLSFHLWHASEPSPFCGRFLETGGVTLLTSLDGFKIVAQKKYISLLLKMAADGVFPDTLGLMVDLNESAVPDQWEQFFLQNGPCPKITPDIVGVSDNSLHRFRHQIATPALFRNGELTFYSRAPLSEMLQTQS